MPLLRINDINLSRGSRPVAMKKVASYFLRIGILAALAIPAFAETRTVSWNPVTMYTDNTLIGTGITVSYSVYWTTDPGLGSLRTIATSLANTSTTFDPDVQGMTRGGTVYFTAKDVLSTGVASALSPAFAWVVPLAAPAPAAPNKIGITGPFSSGTTAVWRLAWDKVTTYANGTPLDAGRTVRYTTYWTDDSALSAASLRQMATLISGTTLDFDPSANQMPKNKVIYLTVRAILDTGDPSALAPGLSWRAENVGPAPPARGKIIKK